MLRNDTDVCEILLEVSNMTEVEINGLPSCPICKSSDVRLLVNARGSFQVRCFRCKNKTRWGRKIDVIIDWFNSAMLAMNEK